MSGFVVAHFLKDRLSLTDSSVAATSPLKTADEEENRPKIAPKGQPQPKAVMDEIKFDFGRTQIGETQSHPFTIRNEGEAPLILKLGHSACQCTVGEVPSDPIAPGGSADISISWTPKMEAESFNKTVEIWTNDPDKTSISLTIDGMVTALLTAYPDKLWEVSRFSEGTPTVVTGYLVSQVVDSFAISGIESSDPHISAVAEKVDAPADMAAAKALCAYQIKVTIQPDMPVGEFNVPLKIKTDLTYPSGAPVEPEVMIRGNRQGPIRISGEKIWIANRSTVAMGTFESQEGKKVELTMIVLQAPPEGLQILEGGLTCDPEELRVTLAPDDKFKHKVSRYFLKIEYPPGSPRTIRADANPGKIKLRTNHPLAPEVELQVMFNAT
ncbi:MAG TPA: DUF1573 domain-containing protein [Planctomycetaceae bacterium]|nr:DUF1573 domain-containing protein [Planctomycetaceae bacterium]